MTLALPNLSAAGRHLSPHHSQAWCEKTLKIKDKNGVVVPLRYNSVQKDLNRRFHDGMRAQIPVRLIILKARQIGCSTWTESVVYDWINHVDNQDALILADSPKSSTRLYEMFTTFYDHHIGHKPTRHMHSKGLKFQMPSNSQVVVDTAKRKYAGTSLTVQCAHLSEVAKWDDPATTFLSLAQALPGRKNTFGVMESTAAGAGDWFNEQWDAAERGESAWEPCFYSWFSMPEYSLDPKRISMEGFGKDSRYNMYEGEEQDLVEQFKCNMDQMAWRRWAIANNCGGDVLLFHQEYPSTPEEAFISAGTPRFNVQILSNWRQHTSDPMAVGMFPLAMSQVEVVTQMQPGDMVNLWEMPDPTHNYVIGADCAGSSPDGDYSAAVVIDASVYPVRVVATIHGWMDADVYSSQLASVGRLYNNALLAIEVNGIGDAVQNQARHLYHNFYHRLPIDREIRMPGDRIGWCTSYVTRPMLVETLAAAIRDEDISCPSDDVILELLSFHSVPGPRVAEAKPGTHDDYVFALGIAIMAMTYKTSGEYRHYDDDDHSDVGRMSKRV